MRNEIIRIRLMEALANESGDGDSESFAAVEWIKGQPHEVRGSMQMEPCNCCIQAENAGISISEFLMEYKRCK